MAWIDRVWDAGLTLARPFAEAVAQSNSRSRHAVAGRRASMREYEAFARSRDARPLVWLHAPSVGEALMAQAIAGELRARADVQIAFTHFSPSAERVRGQVGADVAGYLPWDTPRHVNRALDRLHPSVIAFVRTEIWPGLVRRAHARGVRLALVNAPLAEDSSRLRPLVRFVLGTAWSSLDRVGAVSAADGERFIRLGVDPGRVRVTGDARFDQVAARVARMDPQSPLLQRLHDPAVATLVAGSTWPTDEAIVLDAFEHVRSQRPARLIIAPHEPRPAHLDGLLLAATCRSFSADRLRNVEPEGRALPDVVVVDRLGVLADLYAAGRAAYVGGGFGRHGLHSVIEPAALGRPVAFGPHVGNAREAIDLAAARGGAAVRDASSLSACFARFLESEEPGRNARAFVESRRGGAARNAALLLDLLSLSPGHAPTTPGETGEAEGVR